MVIVKMNMKLMKNTKKLIVAYDFIYKIIRIPINLYRPFYKN